MSLSVQSVSKRFGATQALDSIDLEVKPGEVVALLGENGAGKSTLSNIIAGTFAPDTGSMTWNGQPYAPAEPGDAIAAGIGMIHQELRLLPDLTVAENVFIGRWPIKGGRVDREQMNARAAEQLHRLGLDISPNRLVRSLRVAAQQQVEIAKALTLDAKLLLLDEPTAALGAEETEQLFAVIDQLRTEGVSFIYVSHRLEEIARIADRVVVLRDGRWVASHESAQVPVAQLIQDMVGRNLERLFPDTGAPTGGATRPASRSPLPGGARRAASATATTSPRRRGRGRRPAPRAATTSRPATPCHARRVPVGGRRGCPAPRRGCGRGRTSSSTGTTPRRHRPGCRTRRGRRSRRRPRP